MGLYLLNISVDTPDQEPEHISEDLTINDQESIVEIIIEQVLGYEDAIKEYDDDEPEDCNTKTNIKIDLINRYLIDNTIKQLYILTSKQHFPNSNCYLAKGFQKLDTPPPKT